MKYWFIKKMVGLSNYISGNYPPQVYIISIPLSIDYKTQDYDDIEVTIDDTIYVYVNGLDKKMVEVPNDLSGK